MNGRSPGAPPPEFPITSQIEGELRELRVRFARTRYRVLYQRSDNLLILLHAFEKNTGSVPTRDRETAKVATAAGTSHSAVSRLEKGTHIPQLPTLQRIAAVLDEELLVCFQTQWTARSSGSSRLWLDPTRRTVRRSGDPGVQRNDPRGKAGMKITIAGIGWCTRRVQVHE